MSAMSFETLSHSPDFELPDNSMQAPTDLVALIEEMHEGLHRIVIKKFIRRNKYSEVARIKCQDAPSKKGKPPATPEDIAEYCMLMMQYDVQKTDEPGKYNCVCYSGQSKGQRERSKHVDLSDQDGEAKSITMLSEGDMVEQLQQYVGELHSQMVAVFETLHGMVKPLMQENKEMMKIVSDSQRRLGEVEAQRLKHDLELRIHHDEIKKQEAADEVKMEQWRELMGLVKKTKAAEKIVDAVAEKISEMGKKKRDDEDDDDDDDDDDRPKKKKKKKKKAEKKASSTKKKKKKTPKPEADTAKKKKKTETVEEDAPAPQSAQSDEMTEEELANLEDKLREEGMARLVDHPLVVAAETLKMAISEKNQWPLLRETLTEEQMDCFDEVFDANSEEVVKAKIKALLNMKGRLRILKLREQLDETQTKVVEILFKAGMEE